MRQLSALLLMSSIASCGGVDTSLGTVSADGGTCGDTWADYAQPFFATTCSNCHQHASEFTTEASVQAARSRITSQISSGSMPQGAALSAAQRTRILNYLNCGAL